jgi:hypothetical protein
MGGLGDSRVGGFLTRADGSGNVNVYVNVGEGTDVYGERRRGGAAGGSLPSRRHAGIGGVRRPVATVSFTDRTSGSGR